MERTRGNRNRTALHSGAARASCSVLLLLLLSPVATLRTAIVGAGSSAIGDLTRELILAFSYTNAEATFTYSSLDSTRGVCRLPGEPESCPLEDNLPPESVDFAGADYGLTEQQQQLHPDLLALPVTVGSFGPVYNLPGISNGQLHLGFDTLARIFQCNITSWRDPAILTDNPGIQAQLPDEAIQVVYRPESSGVHQLFFSKLAEAAPDFAEAMEQGRQCTGSNYHTEPSNQGLGYFVSTTRYSLGVVTWSIAAALEIPLVRVGTSDLARGVDMEYAVEARVELMSLPPEFGEGQDVQSQDTTPHQQFLDAIGWPFVSYHYIVFHKYGASREGGSTNCANARRVANFLTWMYTSPAADDVMRESSFTPLPGKAQRALVTRLLELTCNGKPLVSDEEYLLYEGLNVPTISISAPAAISVQLKRRAAPYTQAKAKFLPVEESDCSSAMGNMELSRVVICEELPPQQDSAVLPYGLHTIIVAVNIPGGLTDIQLDFKAMMGILQGNVTHFNDPLLVALNPGLVQVEEPIIRVGSTQGTDVMRSVQRTLLADGASNGSAHGAFPVGGCDTADVCHDSIIQQRHYLLSHPYTLAFFTGASYRELQQASNIVLASIAWSDTEGAVAPSPDSVLACASSVVERARHSGSSTRPQGCYPLTFQSYVMLHRDYTGPRVRLAIEAVRFWDWMLVHGGGSATHTAQDAAPGPSGITQLTENELMVELYLHLPEVVRTALMSLQVNGEKVLVGDARNGASAAVVGAISGTAAAAVLLLAACGLCVYRRNRVLAAKVKALEGGGTGSQILDVDSPLVKTLQYLDRQSKQGGSNAAAAEEAGELFVLLRNADKRAIPTALLKAATGDGDSTSKPIMSYLLDLTNVEAVQRAGSSHASSDSLANTSMRSVTGDQTLQRRFERFHERSLSQSQGGEQSAGLPIEAESYSKVLPPHLLSSLGTSFFFNVMHLKKHGIQQPLAFVTYMALDMTGLTQSMKLHRGKLKTYLERVDSFYQAENMYHNAWHAADVVQRVAVIMAGINLPMTAFDNQVTYLAAILGAAIHDAAHPGRDNKFMIRHEEVLARRFNNQHVLENHSLHLCLEMMREEGTDFLEGSRLKFRKMSLNFKSRLINVVLATDMANHFDILSKFKSTFMGVTADAPAEQRLAPHMELILQMVIKCADLGHCTMMRRTHLFWSKSLEAEFFAQGDLEKADGAKPSELSPLTDRDQPGAMSPSNQVGFFNYIVLPMFNALAHAFPGTAPLADQAEQNLTFWKAEQEREASLGLFCAESVDWYERDMLDCAGEASMLDDPNHAEVNDNNAPPLKSAVSRLMVLPSQVDVSQERIEPANGLPP